MVWRLAQNPSVDRLFAAPGNAGIAQEAHLIPVAAEDVAGIVGLVERERIDLTIVGPETPLVAGLADALDARGYKVFGPSKDAARIEGSKAWAKELMARHGIPPARSRLVTPARGGQSPGDGLGGIGEALPNRPSVVEGDG